MNQGVSAHLRKEFKNLRVAMRSLDQTLQRLSSTGGSETSSSNGRPRRKVRISPKARAALVLQGRYMGFMRQLKPRQKAQVRQVREAKGVRPAIEKARMLAKAS
jgi:hypothetical protein